MACGTLRGRRPDGSAKPLRGLGQHSGNLSLHLSGLRRGEPVTCVQHHVHAGRQQAPVLANSLAQQALAAVPDYGVANLAGNCQADAGGTGREAVRACGGGGRGSGGDAVAWRRLRP